MFSRDMKGPVRLEVAAEVRGPHLQHRFGHGWGPTHPGPFHPVLDQVFTGPLHHASRNEPPLPEVRIVAHAATIPVQIARHRFHDLAPLAPEVSSCGTLAHALHHPG
jgi:hypothetical protein